MVRRQLPLDLPHLPAFEREDFLVAPPNEAAVAWLDRWPDWPSNALVIYGPAGCGKTHLAHVWRKMSGAREVKACDLVRADLAALLEESVKAGATGSPAIVIDDAHEVVADKESERALFHLRNMVLEADGTLLLTARSAASRWGVALPDLSSRLKAMPQVAVERPSDALIAAVLVKMFSDRQLSVGEDVIDYLTARMERSFEAAVELVARLDHESLSHQRRITVPLARKVLEGFDQT